MKNRYMSFEKFNKLIDFLKNTYGLTEEEGIEAASDVVDCLRSLGLGNRESMTTQAMSVSVFGKEIPELESF